MGKEKTTTQASTTYTPTEAEKQMQELELQQYKQLVGPQTQLQLQGMDLVSKMFAGGGLPGYFGEMAAGISPEAVGTQASQFARQYMPGFQQMGLGDSGVAFRETARGIANELLYPAEQFNIGAKQNLLNLALSGQAQVQAPIQAQTGTLASSLAGLRTMSQQGATYAMNPFLKSFQTSMGQTLGSQKFWLGG